MEKPKSVKQEDVIKFVTGLSSAAVALIATVASRTKIPVEPGAYFKIPVALAYLKIPVDLGVYSITAFATLALVSFAASIASGVLFYHYSAFPIAPFARFADRYTPEKACQWCIVAFLFGVVWLTIIGIIALGTVWMVVVGFAAALVYLARKKARTRWQQWRYRRQVRLN